LTLDVEPGSHEYGVLLAMIIYTGFDHPSWIRVWLLAFLESVNCLAAGRKKLK